MHIYNCWVPHFQMDPTNLQYVFHIHDFTHLYNNSYVQISHFPYLDDFGAKLLRAMALNENSSEVQGYCSGTLAPRRRATARMGSWTEFYGVEGGNHRKTIRKWWFSMGFSCLKPLVSSSGWWFGTWLLFSHSVGNDHPNWLSYFAEGLKPLTSCRSKDPDHRIIHNDKE